MKLSFGGGGWLFGSIGSETKLVYVSVAMLYATSSNIERGVPGQGCKVKFRRRLIDLNH